MNIITDTKNIKEKAGKAFNDMIKNRGDKPLLLLLSGGSSLGLLEYVTEDALKGGIAVGMLDDRYSTDPTVNTFKMLQETGFYHLALDNGGVFLDSSVNEREDLELYATRYELQIKKWMDLYPDGIIRATIGIGPDGHTSGILPHPEDPEKFEKLFNGKHLAIGYDVGEKNIHRYRLTSTCTFMKQFDQSMTYMTGESKRDALKKVLAETGTLAETPGRIVRELKNSIIFTDIEL